MFLKLPDVIILAGGLGTRLREAVKDIPKSMAPINGRPFLEYQLRALQAAGLERVIISTGFLGEQIQHYFGSSYRNMEIIYSHEHEPLGTGGAVKLAFNHVQTPYALILNGDTLFKIDLDLFFQRSIEKLADVSIALRKVEDVSRYGSVECNNEGQIISFNEKKSIQQPGLINGGIYLIASRYFRRNVLAETFSLEKDFFGIRYKQDYFLGQVFSDYFLDIGIPSDYLKAQHEIG
ncbi:MAG: nucleotidyltransferase family protein [Lentimicrobium sp.]|jgi:D-glycero-alpha-D-manno-heptose 1-phosphate guanylyltransferase|nr:nucleotidyltransferase family protein [Lentimicrobium sp.]